MISDGSTLSPDNKNIINLQQKEVLVIQHFCGYKSYISHATFTSVLIFGFWGCCLPKRRCWSSTYSLGFVTPWKPTPENKIFVGSCYRYFDFLWTVILKVLGDLPFSGKKWDVQVTDSRRTIVDLEGRKGRYKY